MCTTEGRRYLGERILRLRVGLIWLWVLVCVLITTADPLSRLPWLAVVTALFMVAFRLWDDLADLDYDREYHPQRCLSRSADIQSFWAVLGFQIAGLASLLFFVAGGGRALAFAGLVVAFLVMYRATAKRPERRPLRVTLVLAKYPAVVLLLAHDLGRGTALLAAFAAYLPPLLDEIRSTGPSMFLPVVVFMGLTFLSWMVLMT